MYGLLKNGPGMCWPARTPSAVVGSCFGGRDSFGENSGGIGLSTGIFLLGFVIELAEYIRQCKRVNTFILFRFGTGCALLGGLDFLPSFWREHG